MIWKGSNAIDIVDEALGSAYPHQVKDGETSKCIRYERNIFDCSKDQEGAQEDIKIWFGKVFKETATPDKANGLK